MLANGSKLEIVAENNSASNVYVQSCKFNGVPWQSCRIPGKLLLKGGRLEFMMGSMPNKQWGVD
jgi:putative alpha-1,2-mannosidase